MIDQLGPDDWPMYASVESLSRAFAIRDLLEQVIDLPGHVCEVGCWQGVNLIYLAKLVMLMRPHRSIEVIGFDWFKGLADPHPEHDIMHHKDKYQADQKHLETRIEVAGLSKRIKIVRGDVRESVAAYVAARKTLRLSFVYMDLDLHEATAAAISELWPLVLPGGIMAFDEYNQEAFPGETAAVDDYFEDGYLLQTLPGSARPSAYVIKGA